MEVVVSHDAQFNLFSTTKLQADGWTPGGNKEALWLTKGEMKIVFDIPVKTKHGVLYCMYIKRDEKQGEELAAVNKDKVIKLTEKQAHDLLGHPGREIGRKTAMILGWELKPGNGPM